MHKPIIKPTSSKYFQTDRFDPFHTYLTLYFDLDGEPTSISIRKDKIGDILYYSGVNNNFFSLFGISDIGGDSVCFEQYFNKDFNDADVIKIIEYLFERANRPKISIPTKTSNHEEFEEMMFKMLTEYNQSVENKSSENNIDK